MLVNISVVTEFQTLHRIRILFNYNSNKYLWNLCQLLFQIRSMYSFIDLHKIRYLYYHHPYFVDEETATLTVSFKNSQIVPTGCVTDTC